MDTVLGKQGTKTVLMVLSERAQRKELIYKIASKSQLCVVKVLDKLERKMGKLFTETFKTITCDNGCENLDFEGIEHSVRNKRKRTKVYYVHLYSSWERGTNENINKMILRFIPKGVDISTFSSKQIMQIQHWINNYPRRIFGGLSANMLERKSIKNLTFYFSLNCGHYILQFIYKRFSPSNHCFSNMYVVALLGVF